MSEGEGARRDNAPSNAELRAMWAELEVSLRNVEPFSGLLAAVEARFADLERQIERVRSSDAVSASSALAEMAMLGRRISRLENQVAADATAAMVGASVRAHLSHPEARPGLDEGHAMYSLMSAEPIFYGKSLPAAVRDRPRFPPGIIAKLGFPDLSQADLDRLWRDCGESSQEAPSAGTGAATEASL